MPFRPELITAEHIRQAIAELEKTDERFPRGTRYALIYDGKQYPPKEILRRAHRLANGEYVWQRSGGPETNDFLRKFEYIVVNKNDLPDPFPKLIAEYKELVRKQGLHDEIYKWDLLQTFGGSPNLGATDLLAEFKRIKYSNLIYGPGIGVIHDLARQRTDAYREALRRLFDEQTDLTQRVKEFTATANRLYREIQPDGKRQAHHDERTIATLLTYHNPGKYAFYKDSFFQTLCKTLRIKSPEPGQKYAEYLSIVNGFIEDYIADDHELIDLVNGNKSAVSYKDPNYKLLAQDILYRMLEINGRTFDKLVDEIAENLEDEEGGAGLRLLKSTQDKDKNKRHWVWAGDAKELIGTKTAHYELEVAANKQDKIRVCLHFEDASNNAIFEKTIEKKLPDGLQWFKWFDETRSLRFKKEINFYGEQTVPEVISTLKYMDRVIGNQVRNILNQLYRDTMAKSIRTKQPLNQILYGPPGTGKTYHTVNKALQILGEDAEALSRASMKEIFDRHVAEERIVFTSFHQSLGYEDFIEGFKPVESDDEKAPIRYEIKPGIFKTICNAARGIGGIKVQQLDVFKHAKFYKMSLGGLQNPHIHDWCIKYNKVGMGWGGDKDFSGLKKIKVWKEYRERFQREFPDLVEASRFNITAMFTFQKMKIGDIVVISKGNHIIDAIGRITGDYEWDDQNDFGYFQSRNVEWLATGLNQQPSTFFRKQISQQSIYEFFDEDVKKETFNELFQETNRETRPYVLIIDEINRGNVSKIFGELITLLEPDKRSGHEESLQATLPYTRDSFSVPANLYIIGTMNTADRSVEALDTALRRRFSFEEMQPQPELLSPPHVIWRFFWKHEKLDWENKDYLIYEDDLFQLLGPNEQFKTERRAIWDSFAKAGQQYEQIELFKGFDYSEINLERLLRTINNRLEVLKDRDHLIGHAYFVQVYSIANLITVFRDNLIPLLQEYFFGDYYKIQLVIGAGFITTEDISVGFAVDDEDQFDEKKIYRISLDALHDEEAFLKAIKLMKL